MDWHQRYDAELVDAALLLTLWQRCAIDNETLGSRIRLMKLAFLAARRLSEQGIFALNLEFHQWKHGPSSPGVLKAWRRLQYAGHIREEEVWELSDQGTSLANDFYRDVVCKEEYGALRTMIDELASRWAAFSDDRALCEHIASLTAGENDGDAHVGQAELFATFLEPPVDGLPLINLDSETAWVETLALELSPRDQAGLQRAVEDFRAGRFRVA